MRYLTLPLLIVVLSACTDAITMRHPVTGATAQCGPYTNTWTTPERESQCIRDFQRQGYERAPQ